MDLMQFVAIISEWQTVISRVEGIERHYNLALFDAACSKPIKIVTGFRRSGKSFLLQMVARKLIEAKKYAANNILYLNFEDYRLKPLMNLAALDNLIQSFKNQIAGEGKKLIILDEIQQVENWDQLIRTLYEKESEMEFFLTGSNSELLSSEISSNLAGRFVSFEILPFSFLEFLQYQQIFIKTPIDFYKNHQAILALFNTFMLFGGLPEILTIQNEDTKYSYLQGILSKVILDDVIERFKVRQVDLIEQIIQYLHRSIGNIISPTRVSEQIKNSGVMIKHDTVSTYIDYITKTFAMYAVEKFDWKLNRVFSKNKKYYTVDTGIANLYKSLTNNYSKQLENIVFLQLKRTYSEIYYGAVSTGKEIDFIIKTRQGEFQKYQVTQTLQIENSKRELSSFVLADDYLTKGHNILLTMDENEEEMNYEGCKISKCYLLKWLLGLS